MSYTARARLDMLLGDVEEKRSLNIIRGNGEVLHYMRGVNRVGLLPQAQPWEVLEMKVEEPVVIGEGSKTQKELLEIFHTIQPSQVLSYLRQAYESPNQRLLALQIYIERFAVSPKYTRMMRIEKSKLERKIQKGRA